MELSFLDNIQLNATLVRGLTLITAAQVRGWNILLLPLRPPIHSKRSRLIIILEVEPGYSVFAIQPAFLFGKGKDGKKNQEKHSAVLAVAIILHGGLIQLTFQRARQRMRVVVLLFLRAGI
ncbi:hypothetical protein R3P38DRAFT_3370885 [Favolaschia claudopus]|uniref:Uncharacterized protein n=1 Tax=Favolaschia claudopus TaxID=2862362 RepID=A0AAV9ZZX7_9AGAR